MEVAYHRFPSGKQYAFVNTHEGPVFLRNIILLTRDNDRRTVAIVHEWGQSANRWEPPKGQMEWKEFGVEAESLRLTQSQLQRHMRKAVLREMMEESYILPKEIVNFHILPVSYQQPWPESGVPQAQFVYQFWTAHISDQTMLDAQGRMKTIVKDPVWKQVLPKDVTEKDTIEWWNPDQGFQKIRNGFSRKMVQMYYGWLEAKK